MAVNVLMDAKYAIRTGEFMEAVHLLQTEDMQNPKVLSLLAEAFFYMGRFEEAYKTYHKLFHDSNVKTELMDGPVEEYDKEGQTIYQSLINLGIPTIMERLPLTMDFDYKQSKETPKESYDELLEFQVFLERCAGIAGKDMKKTAAIINDELEVMMNNKNKVIVARAWMYRAELSFRQKDYMEAYRCYLKAALTEVNKALYFGYAANMLMKCQEQDKNFVGIATVLTYRAIELDYTNAKWHYNQGLNLMSLAKLFTSTGLGHLSFLKAAKKEFSIAYQACREDQKQLKEQIEKMYTDVKKIIK
ncbi:MAG: hypothetical protein PUC65_00670 [Clostridiales bacterium]|nr:hypothetical protein [Clostridiales bacterium]